MHPQRAGMEAGIHQEARHRMSRDRLAVDSGDQQSLVAVCSHCLLAAGTEEVGQPRGHLRALWLFGGKKDQQVGIAATEPRDQLPIAQDHLRIDRTVEDARCGLPPRRRRPACGGPGCRILFGHGQIGPEQHRPVWIGRIGRGQLHKLRLLGVGSGAQLAQQVHGGRQRKLRGAQSGHKVAAADAPTFFQRLEHVVDRAEAAGTFSAATDSRSRMP